MSPAPLTFWMSSPGSRSSSKELVFGYPCRARMLWHLPSRERPHSSQRHQRGKHQTKLVCFFSSYVLVKGKILSLSYSGSMHEALRSALLGEVTAPRVLLRDLSTACAHQRLPEDPAFGVNDVQGRSGRDFLQFAHQFLKPCTQESRCMDFSAAGVVQRNLMQQWCTSPSGSLEG